MLQTHQEYMIKEGITWENFQEIHVYAEFEYGQTHMENCCRWRPNMSGKIHYGKRLGQEIH